LISSGTVPLPFNTWSPSGYYLKPQLSDQFTVGLFKNLNNNTYETSVEAYYKDIDNVTDFADNAKIFFNPDIVTEFRQGKSWAYGLEFSIQKKKGKLTGFANYTLSKAERKVDGVNMGNTFAANHDRRNVINAAATYDLNSQWSFGAIFSYATGRPITLPSGRYEFEDGYNVDVITTRNGYRLPDYHRLDLAATFKPNLKPGKKWSSEWVFSLYNAYNRKNPFTLYTRVAKNEDGEIIGDGTAKEIRMVYLFPILPSIAYHFKF
jgi:outer membrane cobalamin receptor